VLVRAIRGRDDDPFCVEFEIPQDALPSQAALGSDGCQHGQCPALEHAAHLPVVRPKLGDNVTLELIDVEARPGLGPFLAHALPFRVD
jgi:hypothetical protein